MKISKHTSALRCKSAAMITAIMSLVMIAGCISNDIPYPHIQANFLSISAEGQLRPALIDSANLTVTFYLPEEANIYGVNIDKYTITPDARVDGDVLDNPVDLSSDYSVTLSLYQDYVWTLTARQDIQRYFTVQNQVGTSEINVVDHTVTAYVTKRTPLTSVTVERCKLWPNGATVQPLIEGTTVDFSNPVTITVDIYGHKQIWTVTVSQTDSDVTTLSADGWTCVGWVYGQALAGRHNTVEYRIKGDTEWLTAPDSWITHNGGDFCGRLIGLSPLTTYEARAISDNAAGEVLEFTTGSLLQVPNSDFDSWWLDGKVWDPWPEGGEQVWDSGNKGATTLGPSNTVPTDDTVTGVGQAAMLQTKFVGISVLGKLAAGNIFVGRYVRTDGTNGVLSFGHEFNQRPTRLTGYLKYKTAAISSVTSGYEDLKGRPDTCVVWIALIDSDEPFEIRTNPKDRHLFDPDGPEVIAYGKFQSGDDIDAYVPFDITLDYVSTSRVPKYILITASASKYGDFFTGGNGATLWVDDFKLEYDYQ